MVVTSELKKLYPFRSHYFSIQQNKMHYLDEGSGENVLCLHGNPSWSFYFRELVKDLSKNYRVIAPDHLGCGLSDKPQNFSYTLEDHIANVEKLILHLNLNKITLIVHDWGGPIGMGLALKQRDRIHKLVILNTAAFLSKDIPKRIASLRTWTDFFIRRANLFCIAALYMTTVKKLPAEVKKAYLAPYSNYKDRIAIASFVKDIPLVPSDISYKTLANIEAGLSSLKVPKLILWGAKDFCFHMGFFKKWKGIYPDAQTHVFENAGHYVLEDEPESSLGKIREFLA